MTRIQLVLLFLVFGVVGYACSEESESCYTTGFEPCACQNNMIGTKACSPGATQPVCVCRSAGGAAGTSVAGAGVSAGSGGAAGTGTAASGGTAKGQGGQKTAGAGGKSGAGKGGKAAGGTGATGAGGVSGDSGGPHNAQEVCARWKADRADMSEGTWSGSVASCDPGDISANGRANALRIVNLYRWLADMPAITTDPALDKQAQACAVIMKANNQLSHTPPNTWTCWTQEGSKAASSCNISSGPGVSSVDGYMIDDGNPTTIGHRRWILSNSIGPTGLGSTDGASCMWTMGSQRVGKPWLAWPAPGAIPLQAITVSMYGGFYKSSLDTTGWTFQSDTINLSEAKVAVTANGESLKVTVTPLLSGYGSYSNSAIRFSPDGWQTTAGKTYAISVTGISTPINYQVQVVDCS
jgi:hypothetical protein